MSDAGSEATHLAEVHDRLLRSVDRVRVAIATQRLDLPFATCVITADLPDVYDLNLMVVTAAVPSRVVLRSIDKVAQTAGWTHRRIEVDDVAIAAALRTPLLDAGYTEQRTLTMVLTDAPRSDPPGLPSAVVDVDAQAALTRATTAEQPWATDAQVVEQFVEREQRLAEVTAARAVVAPPDQPVSRCLLLTHGDVTEIDAVGTLRAHRRRGWSSAVMHRAIAEAARTGTRDVALFADTDDWPSEWYARLGFREAGVAWAYVRTPG